MTYTQDVERINDALDAAVQVLEEFTPGDVESICEMGGDPLTMADVKVNDLLRRVLPRDNEGWLSEESVDPTNDRPKKAYLGTGDGGALEYCSGRLAQ